MSTTPAIDYTQRDFDSIKEALKVHIKTKFPDTWSDFYESQMGMAWLELCFTGDTKVPLLNGAEVAICELTDQPPFWVYSYDLESQRVVPGLAVARKTGVDVELVEVEIDNGEKVHCTPGHRWLLRSGEYCRADQLAPGDSLMPLYRRVGEYGYEELKNSIYRSNSGNKAFWVHTHRAMVQGDHSEVVHHVNYNKRDNRPSNLKWMPMSEHNRIHSGEWMRSEEGRYFFSQLMKRRNPMRLPQARRKLSETKKRLFQDPTKNPRYRHDLDSKEIARLYSSGLTGQEIAERLGCTDVCAYERLKKAGVKLRPAVPTERGKRRLSEARRGVPRPCIQGERHRNYRHDVVWGDICLRRRQGHSWSQIARDLDTNVETLRERRKQHVGVNHRVVSVSRLTKREDVYDLSVAGYHNFALTAGVFVHNCAYTFDVLSFYLDVQANETFLPTARDRLSVLNLGKLVGYRLRNATSASVVCKATLVATEGQDIIITKGTTVITSSGVPFVVLQDQKIDAGQTVGSVTFSQGREVTDQYTSDGTAFQKFKLSNSDAIDKAVGVSVDGEPWVYTDSLVYNDGSDKVFALDYDEFGYAYIMFGDGTSGKIPPGTPSSGSTIDAAYRVGGGIVGNIAIGEVDDTIKGQRDGLFPIEEVDVTVINEQRGTGGEERETIEHAKLWIPRWVKTNNRAVTEEDFDTLSTVFVDPVYGAFSHAKARLKQNVPELNTVEIFTWARDSGGDIISPSGALKTALESYFNNNSTGAVRVICTDVEVLDGNMLFIDIALLVQVATDYAIADVTQSVNAAIDTLFDDPSVRPGVDLRISHVYRAVQAVVGVDYTLIDMITASYKVTATVAIGDGAKTIFSGSVDLEPGLPIVPNTVRMYSDDEILTDDGKGALLNSLLEFKGTIDYDSGAFTDAEFTGAPDSGELVKVDYRYILDYQRGGAEVTADGSVARFKGNLEFPPIVPFIGGAKGAAFTDGTQVVIDDGNGGLIGDVDSAGINRIDYDTGSYDFQFEFLPPNGASIYSTYRQLLKTPSEDIPVVEDQLVVEGLTTIRTS